MIPLGSTATRGSVSYEQAGQIVGGAPNNICETFHKLPGKSASLDIVFSKARKEWRVRYIPPECESSHGIAVAFGLGSKSRGEEARHEGS